MKYLTGLFGRAFLATTIKESTPVTLDTVASPTYTDTVPFIIEAHAHQFDTATGTPYYTHPVRVGDFYMKLKPIHSSDEILAALLHDVLEDGLIKDEEGQNQRVVVQDLIDMGYSAKTIDMVKAVSKPVKTQEDKRTKDQKLIDNIAFIEDLVETGTLEDKLLKFCDALSNRERQTLELSGSHEADIMAYRVQKTDDTLQILYRDLAPYFETMGYETLHDVVHDVIGPDTYATEIPSFPSDMGEDVVEPER